MKTISGDPCERVGYSTPKGVHDPQVENHCLGGKDKECTGLNLIHPSTEKHYCRNALCFSLFGLQRRLLNVLIDF